jgi:hypothetical protein
MKMSRKMTVVFHDEDLYIKLKGEAVRCHIAASQIVADAVRQWLENREDADLIPVIGTARTEWEEKGGRPWSDIELETQEDLQNIVEMNQAVSVAEPRMSWSEHLKN